jgi:hypothetical protein
MAGGLGSLSTDYDLADRRRHHAAEADRRIFLLPMEALTRPAHDATEMQADPCRCLEETGHVVGDDVIPGELVWMNGL